MIELLAKVEVSDVLLYGLIALAVVIGLVAFAFLIAFGKLWLRAASSDCHVPVKEFIGMYLRKINPAVIVDCLIMAGKANVPVDIEKLQAHILARRGRISR